MNVDSMDLGDLFQKIYYLLIGLFEDFSSILKWFLKPIDLGIIGKFAPIEMIGAGFIIAVLGWAIVRMFI